MAGGFRGPDWSDGVQDTSSDAVQDTRAKHPFGILGGALEGGADDSPQGGYGNGQNTTISITEPTPQESAEEGAGKIIHSDLETPIAGK